MSEIAKMLQNPNSKVHLQTELAAAVETVEAFVKGM